MKTPGIGELRERLRVRPFHDVPNLAMGSDVVCDTGVSVWGKVQPVGGTIYYGAQQTDQAVTHRMTIRAGTTVTPAHVIDWAGRRFRVRRLMELGNTRRYITIEVEEIGVAS